MTDREKLIDIILRTPCVAVSSRTAAGHIADHLIENGVNFAPAVVNLRIEIDHNDFAEEVAETAKERGWYRKRFF